MNCWAIPITTKIKERRLLILERNIQREVAALDPNMVLRALRDVQVRCHQVIANNGGHIEG